MKELIMAWLSSPRVYMEGVALYQTYGDNKVLKNNFNRGNSQEIADMLVYELCKLVGISEDDAKKLPRTAQSNEPKQIKSLKVAVKIDYVDDLLLKLADEFHVRVDDMFTPGLLVSATDEQLILVEKLAPAYAEIPETMKKVIRIREVYPFLKDQNCPTELKLLVHDMFSAYDRYRETYTQLDDKNSQDENLRLAATVVESYLENRMMWEELDYYKENGSILGKHEMFELLKLREEIAAIPDMDLVPKLTKNKPNITKAKTALNKATTDEKKAECLARLDKWTTYAAELEAEIERRKK